jgi:hypothetical protein
MGGGYHLIAEEASRLARLLPPSVVEVIAARLERSTGTDWGTLRGRIAQAVPSPHNRALVVDFLDRWRSEAGGVLPQSVAVALLTASRAETEHREGCTVELVWTGPDVGVVPLRRTEQAIWQVIDSASQRITVISYAVLNIPRIGDALIRAAERGVAINLVVESPDRIKGQEAYNTLAALGESVASRCSVYLWPIEKRSKNGKRLTNPILKARASPPNWALPGIPAAAYYFRSTFPGSSVRSPIVVSPRVSRPAGLCHFAGQ